MATESVSVLAGSVTVWVAKGILIVLVTVLVTGGLVDVDVHPAVTVTIVDTGREVDVYVRVVSVMCAKEEQKELAARTMRSWPQFCTS